MGISPVGIRATSRLAALTRSPKRPFGPSMREVIATHLTPRGVVKTTPSRTPFSTGRGSRTDRDALREWHSCDSIKMKKSADRCGFFGGRRDDAVWRPFNDEGDVSSEKVSDLLSRRSRESCANWRALVVCAGKSSRRAEIYRCFEEEQHRPRSPWGRLIDRDSIRCYRGPFGSRSSLRFRPWIARCRGIGWSHRHPRRCWSRSWFRVLPRHSQADSVRSPR